MAGVKTKRAGASKPTVFEPANCYACGDLIAKAADSARVLVIAFDGAKASRNYRWQHKTCKGGKA